MSDCDSNLDFVHVDLGASLIVLSCDENCSQHGTGHGVGEYLSVHEGPQGIGSSVGYNGLS